MWLLINVLFMIYNGKNKNFIFINKDIQTHIHTYLKKVGQTSESKNGGNVISVESFHF